MFLSIIIIVFCFYSILMVLFFFGLRNVSKKNASIPKSGILVSIIVAYKNEVANLPSLLEDLQSQDYPAQQVEIIFIDDNSTDSGSLLLENQNLITSLKLNNAYGKKKAIALGIAHATHELIICTDADCRLGKGWVSSIVNHYEMRGAQLILSPVFFTHKNSFWHNVLELEFASLIASTAGAAGLNMSIMANGANIAFTRSSVNDYVQLSNQKSVSGDDVFLLHAFKKQQMGISFNAQTDALVETAAPSSLSAFLRQRFRWSSKSIYYKDKATIVVALLVFLTSLLQLALLVLSFFSNYYLILFLCSIVLKTVFDALVLIPFLKKFNRQYLLKYIVVVEFIYYIYIVFVAVFSFIVPSKWKN
ncbi:MAG: glycosyltransferase [Bacteroidales bacterium]|nr:glycosyltransferase [Bacteroidales bacterium]